jgi:hypothetical protein
MVPGSMKEGVTKDGIAHRTLLYQIGGTGIYSRNLLQGSPSGCCTLCAFSLGRRGGRGGRLRHRLFAWLSKVWRTVVHWSHVIDMRSNHRRRAVLDLSQANCDSLGAPKQTTRTLSINCRAFGGSGRR